MIFERQARKLIELRSSRRRFLSRPWRLFRRRFLIVFFLVKFGSNCPWNAVLFSNMFWFVFKAMFLDRFLLRLGSLWGSIFGPCWSLFLPKQGGGVARAEVLVPKVPSRPQNAPQRVPYASFERPVCEFWKTSVSVSDPQMLPEGSPKDDPRCPNDPKCSPKENYLSFERQMCEFWKTCV